MALAWWWAVPPAEAWHSGVTQSATCDGWLVEASGYSPETMEASFEPASAGSWIDGSAVTVTVTVSWTDYDDVQTHVVTVEKPEVPEEPPVLIPPVEEWQSPPPPDDPPPPATPAEPLRGQPRVTG